MTVKYDSGITNMADAKAQTDFSYFINSISWVGGNLTHVDLTPFSDRINTPASARVNNGKITINLGTPKPEYLDDLSWVIEDGLTVTPSDAKAFWGNGIGNHKYWLECVKDDYTGAGLVYADRDVTINDTLTWTDTYGETITKILNVSLKRGWNYWIESYTTTNTSTNTASTTLPSGFYWTVGEH